MEEDIEQHDLAAFPVDARATAARELYSPPVNGLTLLVDAASLIYRALFSTPDTVVAPDGTPINAAHGFINMLARLISMHDPAFICCADDADWRPEWRVSLIESYKAHRAEEGSAQEQAEDLLAPQMPVLFEILEMCGIPVVGHPGYEAEDVIGTLAERAPGKVAIVSGDRDLFQLVRDPNISILYPRQGVSEVDVVNERYIEEKYEIPGRSYRDFAVMRGDPSDGLPGVRGIGPKTASGLLTRFGSIDAIVEAATAGQPGTGLAKIRAQLDYIERAVPVVTIPTDLPIPEVDLARPTGVADPNVYGLADQWGLGGAVRRLAAALEGEAG
ncbi:MAG: 5'-3' exonuclease H3TH domain-containing protein [Actinomycetota bacterium]